MGVPNSREYNYYHAPNTPFRIVLKSKYRFLLSGVREMLVFMFVCLSLLCHVLSQRVLCRDQDRLCCCYYCSKVVIALIYLIIYIIRMRNYLYVSRVLPL